MAEIRDHTGTADVSVNMEVQTVITQDLIDFIKARLQNILVVNRVRLYSVTVQNAQRTDLHYSLWQRFGPFRRAPSAPLEVARSFAEFRRLTESRLNIMDGIRLYRVRQCPLENNDFHQNYRAEDLRNVMVQIQHPEAFDILNGYEP